MHLIIIINVVSKGCFCNSTKRERKKGEFLESKTAMFRVQGRYPCSNKRTKESNVVFVETVII